MLLRYERNVSGRDFAVGDIHGCFSHLRRSLEAIGFDESADRLFAVGDLVDRGLESHKVLEWLDKPWFHAICGNHDFLTWRSALGDPYPEVDHLAHGGRWLERLPESARVEIGQALAALPLALEVETSSGIVGLIHADCPFDDWREMQSVAQNPIDPTGPVGDCLLWSTERWQKRFVGEIRNVRAVVHGHHVTKQPRVFGNVYFIDTGGWKPGGYFTFLGLDTLKPVFGPTVGVVRSFGRPS